MNGHEQVVKHLLSHNKVNVNFTDWAEQAAFHIAARDRHLAIMKLLLNDKRFDPARLKLEVNATDQFSITPLHEAARYGPIDAVKLLLKHKDIDIEARTDQNFCGSILKNDTALQLAKKGRHEEIVTLLLAHGAIDYPDEHNVPSATFEPNETGSAPSNEFQELERSEFLNPDLDVDLDMDTGMDVEMDLDMQDDWMEDFLAYDEPNQLSEEFSQERWRPWESG
ncbi:ankyrin [Melanomma pulvis-pyrius CBS 109.77]|uniref:Ankyrin n=1 Tax=Melanomma pulvis-pyrius CBS 109.77 TaxID=1314802 RepID=A0A6A6XZC7_9PLEO|nr:ankyrin [Melanomma pulvis-pyrius CBS 109.77]